MDDKGARHALETERGLAAARLAAARSELDDLDRGREPNLDDEHDPEGPTVAFERARVAAIEAEAEGRLDEVERALVRLATGDYGRCAACGGPIGAARLEALPAAERCVACARRSGSARPA